MKDEIKNDLRREVAETVSEMVIEVFYSVFTGSELIFASSSKREYVESRIREKIVNAHWTSILNETNEEIRKTIPETLTIAACSIARILEQGVKSQYKDYIAESVKERVSGEQFIDDIVSRINRKQLMKG